MLALTTTTVAPHVALTEVPGATGGVGRYAIQLAKASGAHVTALVRDAAASGELLRRLGATRVAQELDRDFDLVLDAVGGATFGLAIDALLHRRIGGKAVLHLD